MMKNKEEAYINFVIMRDNSTFNLDKGFRVGEFPEEVKDKILKSLGFPEADKE